MIHFFIGQKMSVDKINGNQKCCAYQLNYMQIVFLKVCKLCYADDFQFRSMLLHDWVIMSIFPPLITGNCSCLAQNTITLCMSHW